MAEKLTAEQLVEVFNKLTGHIDWWCESHHDDESAKNLPLFGDAVCQLVYQLLDYYRGSSTRYEASAKWLCKKYGDWLDVISDYIEEYKGYKKDIDSNKE